MRAKTSLILRCEPEGRASKDAPYVAQVSGGYALARVIARLDRTQVDGGSHDIHFKALPTEDVRRLQKSGADVDGFTPNARYRMATIFHAAIA